MNTWAKDCNRWHGRVLVGKYCHYCMDWDDLPVDDTVQEYECCTCPKCDDPECKHCGE